MRNRIFILVFTITNIAICAQAQNDSLAVKSSVENFLSAFNSFQWEAFRNSFADDATIFFPDWEQAKRVSGRNEIEKTWLELFPEFKYSANTKTLGIAPRDIDIEQYGQTAIATFHLGSGEKFLSRRTLVMANLKGEWKIVHLHASTLFPEK